MFEMMISRKCHLAMTLFFKLKISQTLKFKRQDFWLVVLMIIDFIKHSVSQKYWRHSTKNVSFKIIRMWWEFLFFSSVFWEGQDSKIIALQLWCTSRNLNAFWFGKIFIEKKKATVSDQKHFLYYNVIRLALLIN